MPDIYFTDTKSKAVFAADGPKPQFLLDSPQFKALVVGLDRRGGNVSLPRRRGADDRGR
jgi:hypothetical protein